MSVREGRLIAAGRVVDQVLEASRSDGCVVIVEEVSQAELRFANNTVTTNGTRSDRDVTVIALRQTDGGTAVGTASSSGADRRRRPRPPGRGERSHGPTGRGRRPACHRETIRHWAATSPTRRS